MVKKEKRLQKMRQNPKTVTYAILILVLQEYGFTVVGTQDSHTKVRAEIEGRIWYDTIVVPHGNKKTVSPAAVKRLLNKLMRLQYGKPN